MMYPCIQEKCSRRCTAVAVNIVVEELLYHACFQSTNLCLNEANKQYFLVPELLLAKSYDQHLLPP